MEKYSGAFWASALFSLTLCFFTPSALYYYNANEFLYSYSEALLSLALLSLLVFALVFSLLILLVRLASAGISARPVSIVFVLGILFWAEGNLLLRDYGVLDGTAIDWNSFRTAGIIDSLIWLIPVLFVIARPITSGRLLKAGSIALILAQAVSLFIVAYKTPDARRAPYTLNKKSEFSYSKNRNIVLMVLDAFNTDAFSDAISADPSIRDMLQGFTYFPDSVGGFPHTYPSIPLMLTGRYYDNSMPRDEFIKGAFERSVPAILKDAGYHVFLPTVARVYLYDDIASNTESGRRFFTLKLLQNPYLLEASAFRSAPHYLKRYIFDRIRYKVALMEIEDSRDLHYDLDFLKRMERSEVALEQPAFKYYHLFGLHEPFLLNERLQLAKLPPDRSGQLTQARALMKIVSLVIEDLKRHGIYDSTAMLIIGDHGKGNPEMPHSLSRGDMAFLAPLVLYKPFSAHGKFRVSEAPVSLMDMADTILSVAGLEASLPGKPLMDIAESESRLRRYLSYNWNVRGGWNVIYYPDMKEYIINGNSWDERSWKVSNRLFTPQGIKQLGNDYHYGTGVTFGREGNATPFLKHGWAHAKKNAFATFAVGKRASLYLRVKPPSRDVRLRVKATPYLFNGLLKEHRVEVRANGVGIGNAAIKAPGEFEFVIPGAFLAKGELYVEFDFKTAVSPLDLGFRGGSPQALSLIFENFWILEEPGPA